MDYIITRDSQHSYVIRRPDDHHMLGIVWKRRTKRGLWHAARHEMRGGTLGHWTDLPGPYPRRTDAINAVLGRAD